MNILTNLFGIVAILCAIWVIYDVFSKNKSLRIEMKIVWIILAVLFNVIAAIIYYFIYKR